MADTNPDRECPGCDQTAAAVVHVQSIGSGEMDVPHGEVHAVRAGGYGAGWLLYCHQTSSEEADFS